MKFLSIICIVLGITWVHGQRFDEMSDEAKQQAGAQINRCKSEKSIDDTVFEQIKQGNYDGSSEVPCFLQCALQGTQVLDGNGKISEQSVMSFARHLGGQQQANELYEKCKKYENGNTCESAKEIYECFRSSNAGFL